MKLCLSCETAFDNQSWNCPECAFFPNSENGLLAFCPELAEKSEGFEAEHFSELVKVEAGSFWFRARNKLIIWGLKKYFPHMKNFLEIGCGTGFVLSAIENSFSDLDLYGSEIFTAGLGYAKERVAKVNLFQMDARNIPFREEFDVIGIFDVLEHIEQDTKVLEMIYRALKPGGGVIVTVPQHRFLWSKYDEFSRHIRRYSRKELILKVKSAGFKIILVTSFVSLLLPLVIASRLRWRVSEKEYDSMSQYNLGEFMNNLLEQVLLFELMLIKIGIRFSFGSSLLLVAYKENNNL